MAFPYPQKKTIRNAPTTSYYQSGGTTAPPRTSTSTAPLTPVDQQQPKAPTPTSTQPANALPGSQPAPRPVPGMTGTIAPAIQPTRTDYGLPGPDTSGWGDGAGTDVNGGRFTDTTGRPPAGSSLPTTTPGYGIPGAGINAGTGAPRPGGGTLDAMIEQWIAKQFGGPRDTSAEEALAREQMEATLGGGLVDMRARMGRMGFGASGAMGGMELDARTSAARDLSGDIFDLRTGARQEELARASAGMQGYGMVEGIAHRNVTRDALLDLLNLDDDDSDTAGSGNVGDTFGRDPWDPSSWGDMLTGIWDGDAADRQIRDQIGSMNQGGMATPQQAMNLGFTPANPVVHGAPPSEAPPGSVWYVSPSGEWLLVESE